MTLRSPYIRNAATALDRAARGLLALGGDLLDMQAIAHGAHLLREYQYEVERSEAGGDLHVAPAPASKPARRPSSAEHRHKFDATGKCALPGCAHVKGRGGRPRNPEPPASEALPSVVEPGYRAPAPPPMGDAAADRFARGGAAGSTGRP